MAQVEMMDVSDWDALVKKTYGKPYSFQQQDGCKDRGVERISVPCTPEDYQRDSVPEKVNDPQMGVSFSAWINRDPKQPLSGDEKADWECFLWWERNFYPHVSMVANDLLAKGLLEPGKYAIDIDW